MKKYRSGHPFRFDIMAKTDAHAKHIVVVELIGGNKIEFGPARADFPDTNLITDFR